MTSISTDGSVYSDVYNPSPTPASIGIVTGPSYSAQAENSSPLTDDLSDIIGLPNSDGTTVNPVVSIPNPDQTSHGGLIDSLETMGGNAMSSVSASADSLWQSTVATTESALSSVESAASSIAAGTGQALTGGYGVLKTVGNDALSGVEKIVSFSASTIIFIALGLGVALYIATKTGNLKLNL